MTFGQLLGLLMMFALYLIPGAVLAALLPLSMPARIAACVIVAATLAYLSVFQTGQAPDERNCVPTGSGIYNTC